MQSCMNFVYLAFAVLAVAFMGKVLQLIIQTCIILSCRAWNEKSLPNTLFFTGCLHKLGPFILLILLWSYVKKTHFKPMHA